MNDPIVAGQRMQVLQTGSLPVEIDLFHED
jgi:hypothetical protein